MLFNPDSVGLKKLLLMELYFLKKLLVTKNTEITLAEISENFSSFLKFKLN